MVSELSVAETVVFVTFGRELHSWRQVAEPPCVLHFPTLLNTIRTLIAYAIREWSAMKNANHCERSVMAPCWTLYNVRLPLNPNWGDLWLLPYVFYIHRDRKEEYAPWRAHFGNDGRTYGNIWPCMDIHWTYVGHLCRGSVPAYPPTRPAGLPRTDMANMWPIFNQYVAIFAVLHCREPFLGWRRSKNRS